MFVKVKKDFQTKEYNSFSSPEPKAQGELIVWDSSRRPSVLPCMRPCVHTFKHEYFLDQLADRYQISSGASSL